MAKRQQTGRAATNKKRKVKVDSEGLAYIQATFNNIIITLTNKKGDVISWGSAGKERFPRFQEKHALRRSGRFRQRLPRCL